MRTFNRNVKRKERRQKARLLTKAQKLGLVDKLPLVSILPTFNRKKNALSSISFS